MLRTQNTLHDRRSTRFARDAGDVDVLVNNAGFGDFGMFDLADWDKTERMIALDVTSTAYLTHRFVRGMVARRRGAILTVSSGIGLEWLPGLRRLHRDQALHERPRRDAPRRDAERGRRRDAALPGTRRRGRARSRHAPRPSAPRRAGSSGASWAGSTMRSETEHTDRAIRDRFAALSDDRFQRSRRRRSACAEHASQQ
jgi:NAD(P)-dependent dehydrogenase (short-subunit alcohol dehydrogenase family)